MFTKHTISKFYEDLERLGMKHPQARIVELTGYSKGTVSQYLSKKVEPSKEFIEAFYKAFGDSLKDVSREINTKDEINAMKARISVLLHAVAQLTSLETGENQAVELAKLEAAAEKIVKMNGG